MSVKRFKGTVRVRVLNGSVIARRNLFPRLVKICLTSIQIATNKSGSVAGSCFILVYLFINFTISRAY